MANRIIRGKFNKRGFSYIIVIIMAITIAIAYSIAQPISENLIRQENEEELKFKLKQIQASLYKFAIKNPHIILSPGSTLPGLWTLLKNYRLRKVFNDPFTNKPDWKFFKKTTEYKKENKIYKITYLEVRSNTNLKTKNGTPYSAWHYQIENNKLIFKSNAEN